MIIPNFCLLTAFLYRNHHDKRCATSSKNTCTKFQYTFKFLNDTLHSFTNPRNAPKEDNLNIFVWWCLFRLSAM